MLWLNRISTVRPTCVLLFLNAATHAIQYMIVAQLHPYTADKPIILNTNSLPTGLTSHHF